MDPQARRSLIGIIDNLRSSGVAVLLTTHVLADIEELADHIIVLRQGIIERAGTLAELRGEASSLSFDARSGLDLVDLMRSLPKDTQQLRSLRVRTSSKGNPRPPYSPRLLAGSRTATRRLPEFELERQASRTSSLAISHEHDEGPRFLGVTTHASQW
jgi:ABC-type multidrug transport system ATPase subunit